MYEKDLRCDICNEDLETRFAISECKIFSLENIANMKNIPYINYTASYFCSNCGNITKRKRCYAIKPEDIAKIIESDLVDINTHFVGNRTLPKLVGEDMKASILS